MARTLKLNFVSRKAGVLWLQKNDSCLWRPAIALTTNSLSLQSRSISHHTATAISSRPYTSQAENEMNFEEYRKLRKTLKMRTRLAGIPLAFVGMGISSFVNVQLNPGMFEMQPEEVQPIL